MAIEIPKETQLTVLSARNRQDESLDNISLIENEYQWDTTRLINARVINRYHHSYTLIILITFIQLIC